MSTKLLLLVFCQKQRVNLIKQSQKAAWKRKSQTTAEVCKRLQRLRKNAKDSKDFKRFQKTVKSYGDFKRPNRTEQQFNSGNFAETRKYNTTKKRFNEGCACVGAALKTFG